MEGQLLCFLCAGEVSIVYFSETVQHQLQTLETFPSPLLVLMQVRWVASLWPICVCVCVCVCVCAHAPQSVYAYAHVFAHIMCVMLSLKVYV